MSNDEVASALRRLVQRELDITLDEHMALERALRLFEAMDQAELLDAEQPD